MKRWEGEMLPCYKCAYRDGVPGSAHSRCLFAWGNFTGEMPVNQSDNPRVQKWFLFPHNYDPVWGPDDCEAKSETRDEEMTIIPSPLGNLLSILGGRF